MLTVACLLWQDPVKYRDYTLGLEHAYTLQRMVARNLSIPHEFVCVLPWRLSPSVKPRQVGLRTFDPQTHRSKTRFAKLQLFRKDIANRLGERILYLDLDTVITDDITPLVDRTEDLVLWRNPRFDEGKTPSRFNTSMILLTAGVRPDLYDDFTEDAYQKFKADHGTFPFKGGSDQRWVSDRVPHDNPYWDASDGVYGAGALGAPPTSLPDNARIVFTPGNRIPSQDATQEKHPWMKDHYY